MLHFIKKNHNCFSGVCLFLLQNTSSLKICKTIEILQFYRNFWAGNAVMRNFKNDCERNSPLREMLPI